ncbi:MAG TPA: RDD family protein [Nevskiaceae bacterium]|nr:RDD family protein [Nevskiaceae bacterium]
MLAPVWRRFAAAGYDGLFLLALCLTGILVAAFVQELLRLPSGPGWERFLRIYMFFLGLLLFGWFWSHGGQTPGLKAWHLRLLRADGRALRWPVAAVRYTAMLLCWAVSLLPVAALTPVLRQRYPTLELLGWLGFAALIGASLLTRLDALRRAPQDWVAGTRVVLVPHARARRPAPLIAGAADATPPPLQTRPSASRPTTTETSRTPRRD